MPQGTPGLYTLELSYVVTPSSASDSDGEAADTGSSGAENDEGINGKPLDRQGLQDRVKKRRQQARRAANAEKSAANDKKSKITSDIERLEEKIDRQKERVRKCQAKLDAAEKQACATTFSDWYLLCRLSFVGVKQGPVTGTLKQHTAVRSSGTFAGRSPASGEKTSMLEELATQAQAEAEPGTSASLHDTGNATLLSESVWEQDNAHHGWINLKIHIDRLKGSVLGSPHDLTNVVLGLSGANDGGWCVGEVAAEADGGFQLLPADRVRFLLRRVSVPRCTRCHDPVVQAVTFGCVCNVAEYCSRECQQAHQTIHSPYCGALKPYSAGRVGRVVATSEGKEFAVFWRALSSYAFSAIVDQANPLGAAYEIRFNLLTDASLGVQLDFFDPTVNPSDDEVVNCNLAVFLALCTHGLEEGNVALVTSALNYLYVWCDHVFMIEKFYLWFYEICVGGEWSSVHVVNSLPEYVMFYRPMYEFGEVMVEAALKSSTSCDFWTRLETAKASLIMLYEGASFGAKAQPIRQVLVPEHQRQTLYLIARIFLIMAARRPKEECQRALSRAEECYKDSIEDDKARNDFYNMGITCLQLSIVYLMCPEKEKRDKAKPMREYGMELLRKGKQPITTEALARKTLEAMIAAEHEVPSAPQPAQQAQQPAVTAKPADQKENAAPAATAAT